MSIFRLDMHQASEGDALILSWGASEQKLHHALIDLGRNADYDALRPKLVGIKRFELFTMSHIDADHIAGAMPLAQEKTPPFQVGDVWFNAWFHLKNAAGRLQGGKKLGSFAINAGDDALKLLGGKKDDEALQLLSGDHGDEALKLLGGEHGEKALQLLSGKQGEKLSAAIVKFKWPWNKAFGAGPVSIDGPQAAKPTELEGGLKITLLSPGDRQLAKLEPVWMDELEKAGLRPLDPDKAMANQKELQLLEALDVAALAAKPFKEDTTEPNGSSIAFLAEFDGRRVLLGADAHPGVVEASLRKLGYSEQKRLKLNLFKLCHHGSKANLSPKLLNILDCTRFAISTDGTKHNHPDREAIARILVNDPGRAKTLCFNTRQEHATVWNAKALKEKHNYSCAMPDGAAAGLSIDIMTD